MTALPQSDHLILLVGGNPVPNAVAGRLLAPSGAVITLVHSRESAEGAQRLQTWLKAQGTAMVKLKQVEESNPTSIFRGVWERLEVVNGRRVGLSYTGGTKAMSVHAYRAVEEWANAHNKRGKNVETVFSYLDARKLAMVFDPADVSSGETARTEDVGRELKLKLTDLLELHGWHLKHDPTAVPTLPKSAYALAQVYASDKRALQTWKDWISKTHQPDVSEVPAISSLTQVKQTLSPEIQQSGKPRDWMGWLKAKWLEHHVLDILNGLAGSLTLHERLQNIVPKEVEFDVDVIALRGYQLFAFSCTTEEEKKDSLKLKLFEAYVRARQLGGDEARIALVCCSDKPEGLEREMKRDVDPEGRIRVFGRPQLADLNTHLAQWIKDQSKGA